MREIIHSYSDLVFHRTIGEMIKKHSENKEDIRSIAVNMIDWDGIKDVLDLGCGYGWFEDGLRGGFDIILGIDCLAENESSFLSAARGISKTALFQKHILPCPIDMPDGSFDLVVSAYSLYFFPEEIEEAKRLLRPSGIFLVITHSESMLQEGEKFFDFTNLRRVIRGFSAENGEEALRAHFQDVRYIDYRNAIVFGRHEKKDLAGYIDFKREFISRDADPEKVTITMLDELERKGTMRFNKDDRIF
ncbi:MAG: class I SAM-dependent methyltransferase, partial [Proteobacteria bacterium]|nr:class I SAM-dependent methyltransferase [Pseudomonadota bacterium]